jgi:hypothetical protein
MMCRIDQSAVKAITPDANRSIVGNHPLAIVRYECGPWEFVRHDRLEES